MNRNSAPDAFPFPEMEFASEYRTLHSQAHRRYPDHIEPPYLTWHIVTTLTDRYESDRSRGQTVPHTREAAFREFEVRKQAEIDEVNAFLRSISPRQDRVIELGSRAADSAQAPYIKRDVISQEQTTFNEALLFRCEFHQEFVTFCFFLPIRHPLEETRRSQPEERSKVSTPAALSARSFNVTDPEVDKISAEVFQETLRHDNEKDDILAFRDRTSKAWDRLFDEAWRTAFRHAPGSIAPRFPGRILGNFRGVVLPRICLANAYGNPEAEIHKFEWRGHQDRFIPTDIVGEPTIPAENPPQHHVDEQDRPGSPRRWNRVSAGRCLRDNYGLRHALHWPGGEATEPLSTDPLARRRTVANLVLNGRALYASALAPPLPVDGFNEQVSEAGAFAQTSSRYCIFYCEEHAGRAQDGISARLDRLMLRLHTMANTRLMALRGWDKMADVLKGLNWVDQMLSNLEAEASTKEPLQEAGIKRLYKELNEATSSERVPGGLLLRASRSAHYASEFKRLIPSLHIHRIEGWEPYDMFMSRKLFGAFEHIRFLGSRAETLRQRLDRLVELAQLESSLKAAKSNKVLSFIMAVLTVAVLGLMIAEVIGGTGQTNAGMFNAEPPQSQQSP